MLSKNVLKKYLFQLRVPLSYKQVTSTLEACQKDLPLPPKVNAKDIMLLKKTLQLHRNKTNKVDKNLAQLERDMIERAAEMGHNDAIALLAGEVLQSKDESDEKNYKDADRLLTQLMNRYHPLAFKISGDIAYKSGYTQKAAEFYQLALDYGIEDQQVKAECWRNIGLINFSDRQIINTRKAFQSAIDTSKDSSKVMDCHFYLGQILDSDKKAAKYHFERAAISGLKESFAPLGFLNMNYFENQSMAEEWFKLGKDVGDVNCLVGLMDVYSKTQNIAKAADILYRIRKHPEAEKIIKLREQTIEKIDSFVRQNDVQVEGADRWSI